MVTVLSQDSKQAIASYVQQRTVIKSPGIRRDLEQRIETRVIQIVNNCFEAVAHQARKIADPE